MAANDGSFVDLGNAEDVALGLDAVYHLEGLGVYQVEQLFFCANEEMVINDEWVTHVFDIKRFNLFLDPSSENINFVLTIDSYDEFVIYLVDVSGSLAVVLAVDDWSRWFE